jgi:hypothetical protein
MHEKFPISNRNIRSFPDDLREGGLKWYQLHRFCHNDDRQVVENGLFWLDLIVILRENPIFASILLMFRKTGRLKRQFKFAAGHWPAERLPAVGTRWPDPEPSALLLGVLGMLPLLHRRR